MKEPWPVVSLGEVVRHRKHVIRIDDASIYKRCRVQLHAQGIVERDIVPGLEIKTKEQQVCRSGELLVAEIDAKVGGFGMVPDELDGAIVSSHYFLFSIEESLLDRRFLGFYLRTVSFRGQISAQGSTNYAAIRPQDVLSYKVPLPPLPEQRRIVARIDELATCLADAKRLREHSKAECNALQRAHLTKEFEHLADAYPVRALEEVSLDISDGPHKTPSYVDAGIPFVTVKNMVSGTLDLTDVQYVTPEDHRLLNRRSRAEKGDVLYSKDGATRGRPCFIETDTPFSFFVSVALIKPRRELLDGRYLCHLLNSGRIRERMHLQSRGDMIPHIVLSEIRKFPVPLPPLPVQQRVVAYLDSFQARVDALKVLQERTAAELDALLPSILDKAFRGEL
jgi:type I restriction enzyme, S subunit